MTTNTEIERFHRDHATPEAVAAFFSGMGPDASLDAVSTVLQNAGYNITRSDLDAASPPTTLLSDDDLDNISGGLDPLQRYGMAILTFGASEIQFKNIHQNFGIDIRTVSPADAWKLIGEDMATIRKLSKKNSAAG